MNFNVCSTDQGENTESLPHPYYKRAISLLNAKISAEKKPRVSPMSRMQSEHHSAESAFDQYYKRRSSTQPAQMSEQK
jgi:hypothetical protein